MIMLNQKMITVFAKIITVFVKMEDDRNFFIKNNAILENYNPILENDTAIL